MEMLNADEREHYGKADFSTAMEADDTPSLDQIDAMIVIIEQVFASMRVLNRLNIEGSGYANSCSIIAMIALTCSRIGVLSASMAVLET